MSNQTFPNLLWTLDTLGIITESPVCVQRIVFLPTTADHVCQFNYYDLGSVVSGAATVNTTGTIGSSKTLTSTNNISTSIVAGDVFEILASTGAAANVGKRLVESVTNNDAVTIVEDNWTDETKVYCWTAYTGRIAAYLRAGASDASAVTLIFDPARWFPNLVLATLSAGAVHVYIV